MTSITDEIITLLTDKDEWLSAMQIAHILGQPAGTIAMLANQAVADRGLRSSGVGTPEQPYLVYGAPTTTTTPVQVEYSYGMALGGHGDIVHFHEHTSRKALCGAGMYWADVALRNRRVCTRCRKMYEEVTAHA